MTTIHSTASTVLVAIDISKHRPEVLIRVPGMKRRRRMTITNTLDEFRRLSAAFASYGLPVRIGLKATGNYHRPLRHHLGQAAQCHHHPTPSELVTEGRRSGSSLSSPSGRLNGPVNRIRPADRMLKPTPRSAWMI